MRQILICPIKTIVHEISGSSAFFVLCSSYPLEINQNSNALCFQFFDTIDANNPYVFTSRQAIEIMEFFLSTPSDADIFICCDSGESRSAAIAAALMRFQGESDDEIWSDSSYHPNSYVYSICCEVFKLRNDYTERRGKRSKRCHFK